MALTRTAIVQASLAILDEYGLADLSMRRLGAVLDVKAGALYWHFGNKQTLLAAVADEILGELVLPADDAEPGEWLREWALRLRCLLLCHRDAAELVSSTRAMDLGQVDPCLAGRAVLQDQGVDSDDADATMQALWHFVLGHVFEEQTQRQLAELGVLEPGDPDRSERIFRHGLELLLAGLRATHAQ